MLFPDEDLLPKYSKLLNLEYDGRYRIWNVSEYSYKTELFNDQVNEYVHVTADGKRYLLIHGELPRTNLRIVESEPSPMRRVLIRAYCSIGRRIV